MEEEIKHFKIALRLQGIVVESRILFQLIKTLEMVKIKGGKFTIDDAVGIEFEGARYKNEHETRNTQPETK